MTGPTCQKCKERAITFIRYSGSHLCSDHFIEFVIRRVKKEIRLQGALSESGTVVVALSGGKDSLVTLKILSELVEENRGIRIEALLVDEGIRGYRPGSVALAQRSCKDLGIPLTVVTFRELVGMDLDDIIEHGENISPCAVCGVFRRFALNSKAREMGAVKMATGHNLDDIAQSVLMNVLGADMEKLFRLGPHKRIIPGLVPRVFPLRTIPEKEVMLYAMLNDIPLHSRECPYSTTATRGRYRDVLSVLERDSPGTRHSLLNFHNALKEMDHDVETANRTDCEVCGENSAGSICMKCRYLDLVGKIRQEKECSAK